jgi:hypothetical protein
MNIVARYKSLIWHSFLRSTHFKDYKSHRRKEHYRKKERRNEYHRNRDYPYINIRISYKSAFR